MAITILDYVKSVVGDKDTYTAGDFTSAGVEMIGGCQTCAATLAPYNAYPSTSGYWRCADCIGTSGFATVGEFTAEQTKTSHAVTWLLRLRELQRSGMDFDTALAQANAEAELGPDTELAICDAKLADFGGQPQPNDPDDDRITLLNCPACGAVENITEIWENAFKCADCGAAWRL
jgi:hypothetical protein